MKTALLALILFVLVPFAFATQQEKSPRGQSVTVSRIDPRTGGSLSATLHTGGSASTVLRATWKSGGVNHEVEITKGTNQSVEQFTSEFHTLLSRELAQYPADPE